MVAAHDAADLHVDRIPGREHLADRRSVQRAARIDEKRVGRELAAGDGDGMLDRRHHLTVVDPSAYRLDTGASAEVGDVRGAAQVLDLGRALDEAQIVQGDRDIHDLAARESVT